jgi:hypothetical protein
VKELASLVAADSDIAFISIHTPPSRAAPTRPMAGSDRSKLIFESQGGGHTTIVYPDASLREPPEIVWTPTYLLVGPDLTIDPFRTDLSAGEEGKLREVLAQARSRQTGGTKNSGSAL